MTDGLPVPSDLPDGEFWATRLDEIRIRIDRAGPRILISAELLLDMLARPAPCVDLDRGAAGPYPYFSGALLKITGVNRRVIYRIREYIPRVNGYIAEWPD